VVDVHARYKVTPQNVYYKCAWSPFMGKTLYGKVQSTIVSGHLAWHEGQFYDTKMGERILFDR